jgi:hypothetical protein
VQAAGGFAPDRSRWISEAMEAAATAGNLECIVIKNDK